MELSTKRISNGLKSLVITPLADLSYNKFFWQAFIKIFKPIIEIIENNVNSFIFLNNCYFLVLHVLAICRLAYKQLKFILPLIATMNNLIKCRLVDTFAFMPFELMKV